MLIVSIINIAWPKGFILFVNNACDDVIIFCGNDGHGSVRFNFIFSFCKNVNVVKWNVIIREIHGDEYRVYKHNEPHGDEVQIDKHDEPHGDGVQDFNHLKLRHEWWKSSSRDQCLVWLYNLRI